MYLKYRFILIWKITGLFLQLTIVTTIAMT